MNYLHLHTAVCVFLLILSSVSKAQLSERRVPSLFDYESPIGDEIIVDDTYDSAIGEFRFIRDGIKQEFRVELHPDQAEKGIIVFSKSSLELLTDPVYAIALLREGDNFTALGASGLPTGPVWWFRWGKDFGNEVIPVDKRRGRDTKIELKSPTTIIFSDGNSSFQFNWRENLDWRQLYDDKQITRERMIQGLRYGNLFIDGEPYSRSSQ